MDWADCPNAMLTKADRKYLLGQADPEDYSDYKSWTRQRRKQIRERVRQSLKDFILLGNSLGGRDQEEIFDVSDEEYFELFWGAVGFFDFFYSGLEQGDAIEALAIGLEIALQSRAAIELNSYIDVDINLQQQINDQIPIGELVEEYEDGKTLPLAQLRVLAMLGYVPTDEYLTAVDEYSIES